MDGSNRGRQLDTHLAVGGFEPLHNGGKNPLALLASADGHADPNGGSIARVDPRVVGNNENECHRLSRPDETFDRATVEVLPQGIGRDETESPRMLVRDQFRTLVPPVNDEIC